MGHPGPAGSDDDASASAPASPMSTDVVHDAQPAPTCELRVLTTVAELVESYRLRYDTYSALGYLQFFNQSKLEIDPYDLSSIPFGAFDTASGAMIGTLRLISKEPQQEYDYLVRHIVDTHRDPELAEQTWAPRPHPLPSLVSIDNEHQIEAFNTERFPIHELSRFIVHPEHRCANLARGLVMLGMAHAMQSGPIAFIAGCLPTHVRLYARYGFVKVPHTGLDRFDSVGQIANTIICRSDRLPAPMQADIDGLLGSMAAGATEHTHELSRDSRALFRFAAPRRVRRYTMEW